MISQKRIKVPIYNDFVFVGIYDDCEEFNSKFNANTTNTTDAVTWSSGAGVAVFFNRAKITNSVIVHECVHVANFIFKQKGISLDLDNDEPQAYLTDWLFGEISKVLNKT